MAKQNFKNFVPRPKPKKELGFIKNQKINLKKECLRNTTDKGVDLKYLYL